MSATTTLTVYTDGSCLRNPDGPGGWSAVLMGATKQIQVSGFEPVTTNNRMEMIAALSAMRIAKKLNHTGPVVIHTDSEYVKNGMTAWLAGWKRRGWIASSGKPVLNRDLWEDMDQESRGLKIEWRWVRGHNGDPYNELADTLAKTAATRQQSTYQELPLAEATDAQETGKPEGKRRSIVTLELDLALPDEKLGEHIRVALIASRGKSIRIRETQA